MLCAVCMALFTEPWWRLSRQVKQGQVRKYRYSGTDCLVMGSVEFEAGPAGPCLSRSHARVQGAWPCKSPCARLTVRVRVLGHCSFSGSGRARFIRLLLVSRSPQPLAAFARKGRALTAAGSVTKSARGLLSNPPPRLSAAVA